MAKYGTYSCFGTLSEDAHSFEAYWEQFMVNVEAQRFPLSRRKALFLSTLAPATYTVLRGLTAPDAPSSKSLDEIRGLLQGHYDSTPIVKAGKGKAADALKYVCYICSGDSCKDRICRSLDDELPLHASSVSLSAGVTALPVLSVLFAAPDNCQAIFDGVCTTVKGECSRGTARPLAVAFAVVPEPPPAGGSCHVDSPAKRGCIYGTTQALASVPVEVPEPPDLHNELGAVSAAPTPIGILAETSVVPAAPVLVDQASAAVVLEESRVTNFGDFYGVRECCDLFCERPDRVWAETSAAPVSVLQHTPQREARSLSKATEQSLLFDDWSTYKHERAAKYDGHEPELFAAISVWQPNVGESRKRDRLELSGFSDPGELDECGNCPGKRRIKRWLMAPPKKRRRGMSRQSQCFPRKPLAIGVG